jgi:hypothetical protein
VFRRKDWGMITGFVIFFIVSLAIFMMLQRSPLPKRLGVSLALFLSLSVALYFVIAFIGDKAPQDAKIVNLSETAR